MTHAYLAPSSAELTVACPGSVAMQSLFPQEPTIETRQGDASHWAASTALIHGDDAVGLGLIAGNDVALTDEMIEGAMQHVAHVRGRGKVGVVETLIKNDRLHAENYGTPDHVMFDAVPFTIYIDDYKFGHEFVEVYENWQLINYALLMIEDLAISDDDMHRLRVVMTIVQPRNYHKDGPIRSWTVRGSDLAPYESRLRAQYAVAMQPNAPLVVNDNCHHCTARFACPELQRQGYKAAASAYTASPVFMSPQALGLELKTLRRARAVLDARITGHEEQVLTMIVRGTPVPYFAGERGQARTIWNNEDDEQSIISLGEMMGYPIGKKKAVTPKQALKLGLDAKLVAAYSYTPNGAIALVEDTGIKAAKIFKQEN